MFLDSTVSTLTPLVGMVVTISLIFSLYSSIQSNHQNAHLFLAEEMGEERGDGEAHSGSGTCDGHKKGSEVSLGFLSHSRQTERKKRKKAKEERQLGLLPCWRVFQGKEACKYQLPGSPSNPRHVWAVTEVEWLTGEAGVCVRGRDRGR